MNDPQLHTLLCVRCSAVMGIADDDENYERERTCPHCWLLFRLHRKDSRDQGETPDKRFAKRFNRRQS